MSLLRLPPGLPFDILPQGVLVLSFPKLNFTRLDLAQISSSFKFWGQQSQHQINWNSNSSFNYDIMTSYQNFVQYLKDMKVLIVEFRDKRTGKLVATGILNFGVVMNGFQWVEGTWEWIVGIEEKKIKTGEFIVRWDFKIGAKRKQIGTQEQDIRNSNQGRNNNDKGNNIPNTIDVRPSDRPKINPNNTNSHPKIDYPPPNIPMPPFSNNNKPKQEKKDILEQFKQLGLFDRPTNTTIPSVNYQYEYSKLKLEELELIKHQDKKTQNQINIIFSHIISVKNFVFEGAYQLEIQFPIISGRSSKVNNFSIWSLQVKTKEIIIFNQKISIVIEDNKLSREQLKEYLNDKVVVRLIEGNKMTKQKVKELAYGQIKLAELLISLKKNKQIKIKMFGKKTKVQKNVSQSELYLKQQFNYHQYSYEGNINTKHPNQNISLNLTAPHSNNTSCQHKAINLQLIVYLGKYRALQEASIANMYIRLLIGNNNFKCDPYWGIASPDFDMLINVPVPPNHNLGFVTIQIWNKRQQQELLGVTKMSLQKLNNFTGVPNECLLGTSIMPYCYLDENKEIKSLDNNIAGYLEVKLAVGTPEQGFNFNKKIKYMKQQIIKRIKKGKYINTDPSSNANNNNEYLNTNEDKDPTTPIIPLAPNTNPNLVTDPQLDSSHHPSNISSISSSSKNNVIDQLVQPTPTLSSILFYFLYSASSNKNYYGILNSLLSQNYVSMTQFISMLKTRLQLKLNQVDYNRICYFYVKDLKIKVSQLIKSIQTYRQYQQFINEQFNPSLAKLKQQMEYEMLNINSLSVHLKKYSQNGDLLKRNQFMQGILQILQMSLAQLDKLFEFCKNHHSQLSILEFSNCFKAYDVYQTIRYHRYSYQLFSSFMYKQLRGVLDDIPELIQRLVLVIGDKKQIVNCHQFVSLFEDINVQLSLWEGFVLIESIKQEINGVKLEEGLIGKESLVSWLQKLLPARIFRSPTFGLIHQKGQSKEIKNSGNIKNILNIRSQQDNFFKVLILQFSFPIRPNSIKLFDKQVPMEHLSITEIAIQVQKEVEQFKIIIISKQQIFQCEGRVGVWVPVTEQGNYVGDVIAQQQI